MSSGLDTCGLDGNIHLHPELCDTNSDDTATLAITLLGTYAYQATEEWRNKFPLQEMKVTFVATSQSTVLAIMAQKDIMNLIMKICQDQQVIILSSGIVLGILLFHTKGSLDGYSRQANSKQLHGC